jgi:hypothetical protein
MVAVAIGWWFTHRCPSGYVSISPNADLKTAHFCVARFEMKNVNGVPVSQPQQRPWNEVTRDQAVELCASLGESYALMTNDQWQAVAREIESVPVNWSSNMVGRGGINIGNFSTEMGGSIENNPCTTDQFQPRFPNCLDQSSPDFIRKRTHRLKSGEDIWDVGGNVFEWVSTDVSSTAPGDFRGAPCALTELHKRTFGPSGSYTSQCDDKNSNGFGCIEGEYGAVIFRGGQAGMENSAWQVCPGVFYANTNPFWTRATPGPGFRCTYREIRGR